MFRISQVILFCTVLASVLCLLGGCEESPRERPEGPTRIVVSIPPLAWAVRELAPEDAEILVLLKEGQSEHGAGLTASDSAALSHADMVFLVGWGLESSAERVVHNPPSWQRVLRFSEVIERSDMEVPVSTQPCTDPSHDHGDHHHHHATDPHGWLDPVAMVEWVKAAGELLGADESRIASLVAECEQVHREYAMGLDSLERRHIVTHHNAYGWIAERYDLEVAAVIRPNELLETTPGELNAAVEAVRSLSIDAVFIEPQFSGRAANRLREITGVRLLRLDPLGDGDWPAMMRANLASLLDGLSTPAGSPAPVPSGA